MRPLRLRARVTLLFAGGAALLTVGLSVATYEVVRHNMLHERERSAIRAAYFDAAVVRTGTSAEGADVVAALRALDTGQSRKPLVRREGTWYSRSADDNLTEAVPAALIDAVEGGRPALQRVAVAGEPALVVGIPLGPDGSSFYEVQSLAEARATLRTVSTASGVVSLAGTALAALLSWSVSGRALRPLATISRAARQVSQGDYEARAPESPDPDLKEITRYFNDMLDQVRGRIDRERRFASDVSHELRSPLQTLKASAQVLHNHRDRMDDRTRAALSLLVDELDRFSTLVQSLLELARSEQPARLAPVDLRAVVERAAHRHDLPHGVAQVHEDVPVWESDEQRLDRVLDNLLHNARRHGGGVAAMTVSRSGAEVLIDVDDRGPGVPSDERRLVFDRFARGRSANTRAGSSGTGLGLAIVAQHVEALGGRVEVLDRPGGGGRFRVHLPAVAGPER